MEQHEISIQELAAERQLTIDYSDDDIIIVDNIMSLAEPSATRVKMNFLAICTRGRVQVQMNGETATIAENQLLLCPPNVIFSDFLFSHDFEFKAVFLTTHILQAFLREKISVWNEVMYIHHHHVMQMEEQDIRFVSHFYDMLRLCIDAKENNPYRSDVIQSLIRCGVLGLCGMLKSKFDTQEGEGSLAHFQRFLALLEHTPQKHQSVEHYANELFITPKYLSVVCKRNSGKTANEWITEYTLSDIRYYLRHTDLSIKQVADKMGFANASFFGKYVKEHFGQTPLSFRQGG